MVQNADLNVIELSDDVTVAIFRNVVIHHFRNRTPASSVETSHRAMKALGPHAKVAFFGVIEIESSPPDEECRRAYTRYFEQHRDTLACMTVVTPGGSGFKGSLARAVVTGIIALAPSLRLRFPWLIAASTDEAAAFIGKHLPGLDTAALLGAFATLRGIHPARSPAA